MILNDDPRRRHKCFAAMLAAVVLAVAVGGCGAGSAPRPKSSTSAAATPAGTSASGIPIGTSASGIPTGTQLQQLMPYHVGAPAGWHLLTYTGDLRNSGNQLIPPIGLVANSNDCGYVAEMSNVLVAVPWWRVSWAYSIMDSRPSPGNINLHVVYLLMAGFRPGYAAKQLAWETARAAACPRYTDTLTGARVGTTYAVIPGLDDGALYVRNANGLGTNRVLITETIIARAGNDIVVAQQHSDDAMVPLPELESMCRLLAERIGAFR
jgi:hypothetical protein